MSDDTDGGADGGATPTRRLTPRGSQRRSQLIEFATRKFASDGYHPTSVADIVDGIGVGKGVFYWYFESKEMLLEQILRDAQRGLRQRQREAASAAPDPIEKLEFGIRAAVRWTAEHEDLAKLVEFAQTDERFEPLVRRGRAALVGDTVPLVRKAMKQGVIPDGDAEMLSYAIFGVASSLSAALLPREGVDPDHIADAVVEFCLRGIGARPDG
ncbi:MAG: TetR/AcrR family transcriptional regulator [Microthrixaceae bacterium]|nr:TetR/AcrR family transcriptional regulator [Microthrixaceae bacterium]MCO5312622.1 TetR/AcrR family transcriptional regulator [Microthrixaceae bacterium]HPB46531.1 TetR/AcrR family transcriptional regulator [Microthrixaceae bacterium]